MCIALSETLKKLYVLCNKTPQPSKINELKVSVFYYHIIINGTSFIILIQHANTRMVLKFQFNLFFNNLFCIICTVVKCHHVRATNHCNILFLQTSTKEKKKTELILRTSIPVQYFIEYFNSQRYSPYSFIAYSLTVNHDMNNRRVCVMFAVLHFAYIIKNSKT